MFVDKKDDKKCPKCDADDARSRRGKKMSAGDLDCENIGVTDKNGQDALKVVNAIILVMTYELVNRHFFRQIERLQSLEKAEKGDF